MDGGKLRISFFSFFFLDSDSEWNLFLFEKIIIGDTHIPFGRLGKQLKLPQTAILAIRAPEQ